MIITPSTAIFVPQEPARSQEPPANVTPPSAELAQQPLARTKRSKGTGFFSWFGSKPPASLPSVPKLKPKPDVPPAVTPKPGPAPKPVIPPKLGISPKLTTPSFKDLGQAVIHANKVKTNDALLLSNLRSHSPITVAEATKRLIDAQSLIKSGVIETGPKASRVARDAFISAGITGLVSAPVNVAAYAGSVASGETIKSQYAPGVLPPPFLPSAAAQSKTTTTPTEPSTPPVASIATQLDEAESKLLSMASVVMFVLGDTSSVFTKDESWPKDDTGRLGNLEKLVTLSEKHLKKAMRQNGFPFQLYKAEGEMPTDAKGRLGLIEKRFEHMTGAYEKLRIFAAIKQSENETKASAIA